MIFLVGFGVTFHQIWARPISTQNGRTQTFVLKILGRTQTFRPKKNFLLKLFWGLQQSGWERPQEKINPALERNMHYFLTILVQPVGGRLAVPEGTTPSRKLTPPPNRPQNDVFWIKRIQKHHFWGG